MASDKPLSLGLPPRTRLRDPREFRAIKDQGNRLVKGCLIANWRDLPAGSPSQLGLITPRRVGGAVVRSRARRLLRESFRLHRHELLHPVALVLVARQSLAGRTFAQVERDYLNLLRNARLLKNLT